MNDAVLEPLPPDIFAVLVGALADALVADFQRDPAGFGEPWFSLQRVSSMASGAVQATNRRNRKRGRAAA